MPEVSNNDLLWLLDLVRGWQNPAQVHLRGCPATTYYIASCSERCRKALALITISSEQAAHLPISGHEFASSTIDAY